MPVLRTITGILLFICWWNALRGQEYPLLHYSIDNGLPSNNIYDVCQTRDGNLWFSTDKGIARFNGLNFKTFTTADGLADNDVFTITEDYSGRLWMNNYNGKICYYKIGKIYSAANTPFLRFPLKPSMGKGVRLEKDSSITYNFNEYDFFVNIRDDRLRYYSLRKIKAQFPNQLILATSKRENNRYELLYDKKRLIIDTNANIIRRETFPVTHRYPESVEDKFYGTENDIYDQSDQHIKKLLPDFWYRRLVNHIYTSQGNVFISTNIGLFINDNMVLLENTPISHVKEDGNGNYLICTLNNGFFVLNKFFKKTVCYKQAYNGIARFATGQNGNLYIGTHNKSLFELKKGKSTCLFNARPYTDLKTTAPTHKAGYLLKDSTYFVFGALENLVVRNVHTKQGVKKYLLDSLGPINCILLSAPYVYIISRTSVNRIEYSKLSRPGFSDFQFIFHNELSYKRVLARGLSDIGELWCCRSDSMYRVVGNKPIIQPQFKDISFRELMIIGDYMVGYTGANNLLVCKNYDQPAIRIDTVKAENCIWDKLYRLDDHRILISTDNLYRVLTLLPGTEKPGYTIQTLDNPFIPLLAEHIFSDGTSCFFMKNGDVTKIDLTEVVRKVSPPVVAFTSFSALQKEYALDSLIRLSNAEAKNITLTFATPSFYKDIYCEYAISKDKEPDVWQPAEGRDISLYSLDYGSYTIKLRARSAATAGEFSVPVLIRLFVAKPFWATWWFIAGCILLTGLLIWYRVKRLLLKKEQAYQGEIKFLRLEYKALNVLMNPHFIFNAMNSVQSLINTNHKTSASEYLRTFSDLIRQNMHNMAKEFITLEEEINLIRNYLKLEKLRFDNHLSYEIEISEETEPDDILVPPLLVQPLVENAVKHGLFHKQSTDNLIVMRIYKKDKLLYIEVEDNGVGLNKAKTADNGQHQSYGIENIRKRIAKLALMQNQHISFDIAEIKNADGLVSGTKSVIVMETTEY